MASESDTEESRSESTTLEKFCDELAAKICRSFKEMIAAALADPEWRAKYNEVVWDNAKRDISSVLSEVVFLTIDNGTTIAAPTQKELPLFRVVYHVLDSELYEDVPAPLTFDVCAEDLEDAMEKAKSETAYMNSLSRKVVITSITRNA